MTTTNSILTSLLCYDLAERIEKDAQRLLMNDCLNEIKDQGPRDTSAIWWLDEGLEFYHDDLLEEPEYPFTFQYYRDHVLPRYNDIKPLLDPAPRMDDRRAALYQRSFARWKRGERI